jgi:hypothetical protein
LGEKLYLRLPYTPMSPLYPDPLPIPHPTLLLLLTQLDHGRQSMHGDEYEKGTTRHQTGRQKAPGAHKQIQKITETTTVAPPPYL